MTRARAPPGSGRARKVDVVDAASEVAADRRRLAGHLPAVLYPHCGGAVVVLPLDTDLLDREAAASSQGQNLQVERPAVDPGAAEQALRCVRGERFEPALRVEHPRHERALDDPVGETAPHHTVERLLD